MWKALKYGEKVFAGDTIRYQSNSNSLLPVDENYLVLRIDQHYFEIIRKADSSETGEPPVRKVVRYIDIGYNVLLERWAGSQDAQ